MTVRRLTSADAEAFRRIRLQMLRTDPMAFGSNHADWARKSLAEIADWIAKMHLFAEMQDGRCQATGAWYRRPEDAADGRGHVIAVYTTPELRRQGLFRRIMQVLEQDARRNGVLQLDLDVSASQPAAQAGYLALGYGEVGRRPGAKCHDGAYSDTITMRKRLPA
ncbi:GNAT family N-acetyltransferase [Boseongicola sp. H5]|uniref:GNAT family N-acetyltransferase n=1 Tax=Boseongicola sp. H5 TaxID=2763261 RepID=UPI001D0A8E55|nr:GNAT family N-acetyltransferase [Boseongicola sp. H5]